MRPALFGVAVLGVALSASVAAGQQRPLVTQDPETIGTGRVLVEGGLDYGRDIFFPVSGLKGNLLRAPLLGVVFGVGPTAEIQVTGGLRNRLAITDRLPAPLAGMLDVSGTSTSDVEDVVLATKVRLSAEDVSFPAIALRFATRLPNASNESGLGTDTFDFYATAVGGKTVRSVRVVGNFGLGILGDPTRGDRQNDVLLYGVSIARALTNRTEVVGELNGRANTRTSPPPGTESRAVLRAGARYTRGAVRLDAALLLGTTERDPSVGFAFGLSYILEPFTTK